MVENELFVYAAVSFRRCCCCQLPSLLLPKKQPYSRSVSLSRSLHFLARPDEVKLAGTALKKGEGELLAAALVASSYKKIKKRCSLSQRTSLRERERKSFSGGRAAASRTDLTSSKPPRQRNEQSYISTFYCLSSLFLSVAAMDVRE